MISPADLQVAARDAGRESLYGLLAAFDTPEDLLRATKKARQAGYRQMDAYSPIPVEGLAKELGRRKTAMPLIVLLGGIAGGTGGYFMQWYSMVVDYPYNIGGRPFHSWPMFIPVTFELTVLSAAICGFVGLFYLNGLPRLHHPIFKALHPRFITPPPPPRATLDRFFLCIETSDPQWDRVLTRVFMENELGAREVQEVER